MMPTPRIAFAVSILSLAACSASGTTPPSTAAVPNAATPAPATTAAPSPAVTYAPTTPPLSGIVTPAPQTYALSPAGGTVTLGGGSTSAGTVTFPRNDAPAGTTVSLFVETVRSDQTGGSYTEENVNFTVSEAVTFSAFGPSFSLTPPANPIGGATLRGYFFDATTGAVYDDGDAVTTCGTSVYVRGGSLGAFRAAAGDSYSLNLVVDFTGAATPAAEATCPP